MVCNLAGLPIWLFWNQILKFWFFWTPLALFGNQKKPDKIWHFLTFFQSERLGSGKTLSKLYIHYKSLVKRVYNHAEYAEYWKKITFAIKMINVIDKKQMYDSLQLWGKTMLPRSGNVLYRCFWRVNVYFVFGYALCVYAVKLLSGFFWFFLGQGLAFCGENSLATLRPIVPTNG